MSDRREKRRSGSDAAKRRASSHKSGYESTIVKVPDGVSSFKLGDPEKAMRINLLNYEAGKGNPYADAGELHYERTFWVHKNVGVNHETYVCPAMTVKKPCPICEHQRKLKADPDSSEKLIKSLYPKEMQLFNVVDTVDAEKGVQLWAYSYHLFGKKLDDMIDNADDDDGFANCADYVGGKTLKISFEQKHVKSEDGKQSYPFKEVTSINFKDREDIDEEIIEKVMCLDDLLIIPAYDKLKEVYLASEDDLPDEDDVEAEGDDEEEVTNKKGTKSMGKKKKADEELELEEELEEEFDDDDELEDEDEEEDDVEEDEDEDEEDIEEDEDEEDDADVEEDELEDEDEEEEKPKKTKKMEKKVVKKKEVKKVVKGKKKK